MSNKVGNGELRHMKIIRYFEQEREIVWQHKLLVLFKEVERLVKKKMMLVRKICKYQIKKMTLS